MLITSNLIIILTISAIFISAIAYYLYKKKNTSTIIPESEPNQYGELGLTEESSSLNEHFQFPESKDTMSDEVFNKYKNKEEKKNIKLEKKENLEKEETIKTTVNEIDKLRKDYIETDEELKKKSTRGFELNLEQGILSHEILRKRNKKH